MTLPARLLRSLTRQVRWTTVDSYGATVTGSWTNSDITGRIDQATATEIHTDGRLHEVSTWRLWTDTAVDASDRIVDGDVTYVVDGQPWPVYDADSVHHYEANLERVDG